MTQCNAGRYILEPLVNNGRWVASEGGYSALPVSEKYSFEANLKFLKGGH